jgi:hypothetical protein
MYKITKSYELLNSEGPIIQIQKIKDRWHWKFYNSKVQVVTTTKEILDFICGLSVLKDPRGNTYIWTDYPSSMKGGSPEYIQKIVLELLQEDLEKCKNDINYFTEIYFKAI